MVPADDATDNLAAPQPDARALPGDALLSDSLLASKQTTIYAAREAVLGDVRVQASEQVGRRVSKKALLLSLRANPPHMSNGLRNDDVGRLRLGDGSMRIVGHLARLIVGPVPSPTSTTVRRFASS